ncbi:hypothetical protein G7084_03680 [Weissella coleopterorum]|uniref:Uncharacterized protein n=1 Tax=Weissella coleopterorum TaxID=2714949 RepID=A0A6G8AZK2_9LACO|nr:DsrE family protein [Weissella coleopterorum]QIL50494.1 hypothetical protein G7084_03680 [Weissella coleopterorum]
MLNTIIHIDENFKWSTVNSNLYHLLEWMKDYEEVGSVELLINGEAVEMVKDVSPINLQKLVTLGVDVMVCENSLQQRNISLSELQDSVKIVPSGVVELTLQQRAGYSYIKP